MLSKIYFTTEADMIAACKNGDHRGFEQLYYQFGKAIYNSCYRIVNNTLEAEDMVQETFIASYTHIANYNASSPLEAWLRRIAINKSISHLRKKKVLTIDIDSMIIAENTANEIDEDDYILSVNSIKQGIATLDNGYQLVFNLHVLENMKHEEIAEVLGIHTNTVRQQYHRAKNKIIAFLKTQNNEN